MKRTRFEARMEASYFRNIFCKGDGLDYMYAGVVRSVNVELLERQLQE